MGFDSNSNTNAKVNRENSLGDYLHEITMEAARKWPELPALQSEDTVITYAQLAQKVLRIAFSLQLRGIQKGDIVGVYLPRNEWLYSSISAILKTGAICLPLDPAWDSSRLEHILGEANPKYIIGDRPEKGLPDHIQMFDPQELANTSNYLELKEPEICTEDVAILLYTSGSTGNSKGVKLSHEGLALYCRSMSEFAQLKSTDRVLQFASIGFDTALEEIFCTQAAGACLVPRPMGNPGSIQSFFEWCEHQKISVLDLPTAFWHECAYAVETDETNIPSTLKTVLIGGERASGVRVRAWNQATGGRIKLINGYGPTEASIVATACDISDWSEEGDPPIGPAIYPAEVFIADENCKPVQEGEAGEIIITGKGIALGYLKDPPIKSGFGVSSNNSKNRFFRTGDRGVLRKDGSIDYLGRQDDLVKVAGKRIRIGALEEALVQNKSVIECAVIHDESIGLTAYLAPLQDTKNIVSIRQQLKEFFGGDGVSLLINSLAQLPKTR